MAFEIRMPGGAVPAQEAAMMRQIVNQTNYALNALEHEITQLRETVEKMKKEER